MDPNQTDWTCLKHFFQEHTNWKLKDVDHDIDFHFVTVKQYAQMCFRNICQLLSDFTLLEVIVTFFLEFHSAVVIFFSLSVHF
jgi:hypothetical protein